MITGIGDQDVEFAFGPLLRDVFLKHWNDDKKHSILSAKFRLYYLLRPFIPIPLRQLLQRSRNKGIENAKDWYFPKDFVQDFTSALKKLTSNDSVIHPWPRPYNFAISLTHDVETSEGQKLVDKLAAMEESLGLRSAWYFIPYKYKIDHGLLKDLRSRGHEIGVHGYNHDGRLFTSKAIFDYRTRYINQSASELNSAGFRAPMVHRNLDWMQQLEFDYDASCFDIDPYQAMPGGVGGMWPFIVGKLVELPYTLPQDHTLLVSLGETTPKIWIEKLQYVRKFSAMAMLITHPDYLDTPQRFGIYQEFCEYLRALSDAWFANPDEISKWWRERYQSAVVNDQGGLANGIKGPASERARVVSFDSLFYSDN